MRGRCIIALLACLAGACEHGPKPVAPLAESGELVVLTVNGPSTYFEDAQGLPSGLEYDLATLFAKELKVKATFKPSSGISVSKTKKIVLKLR